MSLTRKQRNALHAYCANVADALNDAGLDMAAVLSKPIELPWQKMTVKEVMWKRVQVAMFPDKTSTEDLDPPDVDKIYQSIARHLAGQFGIDVPFPSQDE